MFHVHAVRSRAARFGLELPTREPGIILRCDGCGGTLGPHADEASAEAAALAAGWRVVQADGERKLYDGACAAQDPLPTWHHHSGDPSVTSAPAAEGEDLAGDTPEGDGSEEGEDLALETPADGAAAAAPAKRRKHRKGR